MPKQISPKRYAHSSYEVGKGKPPQHSRFKPGQSGNPKGRPRKPDPQELLRTGMRELIEELVTVNTPLGSRQVPAGVAMAMKVRQTVLTSGSPAQFRKFLDIVESFGALSSEDKRQIGGVLVVPPVCETAEEWERIYGRAAGAMTEEEREAERKMVDALYAPTPATSPPASPEPKPFEYVLPLPPPVYRSLSEKPKKEPPKPERKYVLPGPPPVRRT